MAKEIIVCFCTVPNEEVARKISTTLVEEKLAACCNILPPVRSIYRWQGKIYDEQELLIIIKTRSDAFNALEKRITEMHPYQVPEVISFPVTRGHGKYLDWVGENVG